MSIGVTNQRAGTCPHGMPMGACPLCAGMSGGGGSANTIRRTSNEMSWNECYAIGQMMKAQRLNKQTDVQINLNNIMQNAFVQRIAGMAATVANFLGNIISATGIPAAVNTVKNIALKTVQIIADTFGNMTAKLVNTVKSFVADISDKIAALLGEENMAKLKKAGEFIERGKKKLLSLFGFVDETSEEAENSEEVKKEAKKVNILTELRKKFDLLKEEEQDD
ncbi:MAG: hypothetical protein PHX18_02130 [Candidatus Gastranaerophilales bacterium]|nr:hypothetical protein [Candidatus Gastranaerophilales bacterium]